ncbi:MAG: oxygenase MpaB family protein [Solirubrobacteraceae bacterium]
MASPGYFTDDSMLRRVQRETVVALAGPRALLMQAAHPVAFAGFFEATTMLAEPYPRLERTAKVLQAIAFGTRAQADAATRPVRAVHRRVRGSMKAPIGRFPAGTPWRANDPELLLWIIATLVDSNLLVYQRYVGSLTRNEQEAYWQDFRLMAKLFGLPLEHSPPDIDAFDAYVADVLASGDLYVGAQARELAIDIVMRPPVPRRYAPLLELVNQVTVGLLPPEVRRLYGFSWDPVRGLAVRGGQEYLRRVVVPLLPERLRLAPSARAA